MFSRKRILNYFYLPIPTMCTSLLKIRKYNRRLNYKNDQYKNNQVILKK